MALRLYFVPVVHVAVPRYECPKYFPHRFNPPTAGLENVSHAWTTYLLEDVGLIAADVTTAQHSIVAAQTDVIALPVNLDVTLNAGAVNAAQAALEGWNVPANWVTTGMTYRQVVRTVVRMWRFHARMVAMSNGRLFDGTVTLSTALASLPLAARNRLKSVADSYGLDYSGVTNATTVRQLLKAMADQFADDPVTLGGLTI
jgi:hypothetical protein